MDLKKLKSVEDGEEVFPPLNKLFRLACCDCGLMHRIEWGVYKDGKLVKNPGRKGYRVSMKAWRSDEESEQLRKLKDFKFKKGKK